MFSEGDASMKNILGGKGANLAEMTSLGLPVPQGFCVSTEACTRYHEDGKTIKEDILEQIDDALAKAEKNRWQEVRRFRKSFPSFSFVQVLEFLCQV